MKYARFMHFQWEFILGVHVFVLADEFVSGISLPVECK
jgi:hypothetical protein